MKKSNFHIKFLIYENFVKKSVDEFSRKNSKNSFFFLETVKFAKYFLKNVKNKNNFTETVNFQTFLKTVKNQNFSENCHFSETLSSTSRLLQFFNPFSVIFTSLSVQSTRQSDLTQKHPSEHHFDTFKSQNYHKSNYFMIYDLKLHQKIQNMKIQ